MKFREGDKVVVIRYLIKHYKPVKIRQYFIIRGIKDTYIIGPRNELYIADELEFKHIVRGK